MAAPTPKSFWTYQAASETPPPPPGVSKEEWDSLSPGMRREIPAPCSAEKLMPAPARKPQAAADRIESTQAALEAANRQLAELTERRNQCLLKDEDTAAAIDLGIKIANLKNAARAHEDRIQLLREQAAEEERARKAKDRE